MTTEQQIIKAFDALIGLKAELEVLSYDDLQFIINNPKRAMRLFIEAVQNRDKGATKNVLSQAVYGTKILVGINDLVFADKFVVNTTEDAEVKIALLSEDFLMRFKNKTEGLVTSILDRRDLIVATISSAILEELGGTDKAETTLTELYAMMKLQPNGEAGELLNNGCVNMFYIKDAQNVLCVVLLYWFGIGWNINSVTVAELNQWIASKVRVFSRNHSAI